jgi:membrane fusion protein (multidrug efflux system)
MEQEITQEKKKKSPIIYVLMVGVAVAAFFGIKSVWHALKHESTDNASVECYSMPVIARVSGYVDSLPLSDYNTVKQGDLLLKIDDREYTIAKAQAEADIAQAEADLENAKAQLINAQMNAKVAEANAGVQKTRIDKATNDLKRDQALFNDNSITKKQLDDSKSNVETQQKQFDANNDQISLASAQIATSNASIKKAEAVINTRKAVLDGANLKLSYTKIYAQATGKTGKLNLEKGQFVQAGQTLFTIVNTSDFWIVANFKETQLEHLKEGKAVDIYVDGFPNVTIKGTISSLSEATGAKYSLLPPDNATGNFVKVTQRVPVKIVIENQAQYKDMLRAGLSVMVEAEK